jgi:hypothetical protein
MEAKLKAKELVQKFIPHSYHQDSESQCYDHAKQCALIAVQMIINANPHSNPLNTIVHSTMQYWLDVKQEIINL